MKTSLAIHKTSNSHRNRGSAMIYIFMAIGLLGILTASLIEPSDTVSRPQQSQRLTAQLQSQISYLRSAILECVNLYPAGDLTVNGSGTTDTGYNAPYPVNPSSTHFTGSTLGIEADNKVEYLRCPGNPGVDNNHTQIFYGANGRFMPQKLDALYDWYYSNGSGTIVGDAIDGVYIRITSDRTDAYIKDALAALDAKYSACEADYIIGNGSNGCNASRVCFRYWLKRNSGC